MMEWISMEHWWKDIDRGTMKYSEKNMCVTNSTRVSLESNTDFRVNSLDNNCLNHGSLSSSVVAYVFFFVFPSHILPYIFLSITWFRILRSSVVAYVFFFVFLSHIIPYIFPSIMWFRILRSSIVAYVFFFVFLSHILPYIFPSITWFRILRSSIVAYVFFFVFPSHIFP